MTVVTHLMYWGTAPNGGVCFLHATWDSPMVDEEGVAGDPAATGLVTSIRYQNMGTAPRSIFVGNRTYTANPFTDDTTLNIPGGQQPNMLETPWAWS